MVAKQPKLEQFAAMSDLVSLKTGKPFQIVPIDEEEREQSEPPVKPVKVSNVEEPRRIAQIQGNHASFVPMKKGLPYFTMITL